MKVTDFINGKVTYDKDGEKFWIVDQEEKCQMLGQLRGWEAIQNMFPLTAEGRKEAANYEDEIGEFVAQAINEKIEKEIKDNEMRQLMQEINEMSDEEFGNNVEQLIKFLSKNKVKKCTN